MLCINCGHMLPDDSEFCQYCGNKIERDLAVPKAALVKDAFIVEESRRTIKNKTPKGKYCSRCGSPVDHKTKVCTGCGKKYFKGIKVSGSSIAIFILSLVLVTSIVINIVQYDELDYLSWENEDLQDRVDDLDDEVTSLRSDALRDRLELDFYEHYAVLVEVDSKKYHKYGCEDFGDSDFWIFNIEAAEQDGYYACPKCH